MMWMDLPSFIQCRLQFRFLIFCNSIGPDDNIFDFVLARTVCLLSIILTVTQKSEFISKEDCFLLRLRVRRFQKYINEQYLQLVKSRGRYSYIFSLYKSRNAVQIRIRHSNCLWCSFWIEVLEYEGYFDLSTSFCDNIFKVQMSGCYLELLSSKEHRRWDYWWFLLN